MALLTKAEIFQIDDRKYDDVPCPEWGGEVRVRGLTASEQAVISKLVFEEKKNEISMKVVQFGCVDADGERLFSTKDLEALGKKSYPVIERLGRRIMELTGSGGEADIEEARKN